VSDSLFGARFRPAPDPGGRSRPTLPCRSLTSEQRRNRGAVHNAASAAIMSDWRANNAIASIRHSAGVLGRVKASLAPLTAARP
jgi:hypothetical protein